jgi:hypothetical protein
MHDPSTVAFQIPYPWPWPRQNWGAREKQPPRETFITIWHVDPETDGTDDSCDWFGRGLSPTEKTAAHDLWENEGDNLRPYLNHLDERDRTTVLEAQWLKPRRHYAPRSWWRHPRWHVWHWSLQVHPLQALKRWLFSRCDQCGQRFSWGYSPIAYSWGSDGPRWFHGERGVYHHDCAGAVGIAAKVAAGAA